MPCLNGFGGGYRALRPVPRLDVNVSGASLTAIWVPLGGQGGTQGWSCWARVVPIDPTRDAQPLHAEIPVEIGCVGPLEGI